MGATNHFEQWCAYSDLWVHSFMCERCIILSTPRLSRAVVSAYNIFIWTFLRGKWVTSENNARNIKWFTLFNLVNIIMVFYKKNSVLTYYHTLYLIYLLNTLSRWVSIWDKWYQFQKLVTKLANNFSYKCNEMLILSTNISHITL